MEATFLENIMKSFLMVMACLDEVRKNEDVGLLEIVRREVMPINAYIEITF